MATVLVFEYVTGGGMLTADADGPPPDSLLREGAAMAGALATDFSATGFGTVLLRDGRLPRATLPLPPNCRVCVVNSAEEQRQVFLEQAATVDWVVLIAPETGHSLRDLTASALSADARLLSPPTEFVAVATDKSETATRLASHGVRAPAGVTLPADVRLPQDFPYPAVRKPRDGAGSQDVEWIADVEQAVRMPPVERATRLERFCPGIPASVAALCGPLGPTVLPACRQRLGSADGGRFAYCGGETPLESRLTRRAKRLALSALSALPTAVGYVGMDVVMGDDPDGADDVVIEVNPRLTTSYVGLRAICRDNLAAAMIDAAGGRPVRCDFDDKRVVFDADGTCR